MQIRTRLFLALLQEDDSTNELVLTNQDLAYSIANRMAPGLGLDLDDAKQEALYALTRAAQKFDPARGIKFSTYAYRAIKNAILDMRRPIKGQYLSRVDLDAPAYGEEGDEETAHDVVGTPDPDLGGGVEAADVLDQVRVAMQGLPDRERTILLGWLDGKDYRTIAGEVGVSFVYVGKILQRVLKDLRTKLTYEQGSV